MNLHDALLVERENNYIVAIAPGKDVVGIALADVSTGEFAVDETPVTALQDTLERLDPRELLVAEEATFAPPADRLVTRRPGWQFTEAEATETLERHFGTTGLEDQDAGMRVLGEAVREHGSGRPAADDDVVELGRWHRSRC